MKESKGEFGRNKRRRMEKENIQFLKLEWNLFLAGYLAKLLAGYPAKSVSGTTLFVYIKCLPNV